MANSALAHRILDYFGRQRALFERMHAFNEALQALLDDEHPEAAMAEHKAQAWEGAMLEKECRVLLREWRAAQDIDEGERAAVRNAAQEVKEMADRMKAENTDALQLLNEGMGAVKAERGRLRQGAKMVGRYRPGTPPVAGFLDRQA